MGEDIVYLDDRVLKRYEVYDRLQLGIAAVAVGLPSLERLRHPGIGDVVLAVLQLLTSIAVVAFLVVWARRRHAPSAARVGWLDLAAGAMLLAEWADRYVHGGKLFAAVLFQAAVFLALGVFHERLAARRQHSRWVRVDDDGIRVRRSLIRRQRIAWLEVASVSREPHAIRITRRNGGSTRIRLGRFDNADEIAHLVLGAAAARGLAGGAGP